MDVKGCGFICDCNSTLFHRGLATADSRSPNYSSTWKSHWGYPAKYSTRMGDCWQKPGGCNQQRFQHERWHSVGDIPACEVFRSHAQSGLTMGVKSAFSSQAHGESAAHNSLFQQKHDGKPRFEEKTENVSAPDPQAEDWCQHEMELCIWNALVVP